MVSIKNYETNYKYSSCNFLQMTSGHKENIWMGTHVPLYGRGDDPKGILQSKKCVMSKIILKALKSEFEKLLFFDILNRKKSGFN